MKDGDSLPGLLGYEVDTYAPGASPANTEILASSPVSFPQDRDCPPGVAGKGDEKKQIPHRCNSHVTWYSTDKASVFATGSMQWSWGLDDYGAQGEPDGLGLREKFSNRQVSGTSPVTVGQAAEQITANLLASFIDPMTITLPSVLPLATASKKYELTLFTDGGHQQVLGGTPPHVWSVAGLPRYLSLTQAGHSYVLTGTPPPGPGTVDLTFVVTDANQQTASTVRSLRIQPSDQTPRALSINFVGQGTALAPDDTVGVVPKLNWTNALGPSGTLTVADESGYQNRAVVTWTADSLWAIPIDDNQSGNTRLMKGYLDTGAGNSTRVEVSGLLPCPQGYDVYVYVDGDNESENKTGTYSLTGPGITTSTTATDLANTNFSGTFQRANNSPGNYVKFSGINATSFTVTATPQASDFAPRAPVNAIQIAPSGA